MGKIKFVTSNYFSIRVNIHTACEKNFVPTWHQKLRKQIKLFERHVFMLLKAIGSIVLYPECLFFPPMLLGSSKHRAYRRC